MEEVIVEGITEEDFEVILKILDKVTFRVNEDHLYNKSIILRKKVIDILTQLQE